MEILLRALVYFLMFIVLWFGSGLIISAVEKASKILKISTFALSFFILGLLTSIPELAVGVTSVVEHDPQIFVGNLLGGIVVIFLLIVPVLAIFGNGINLSHRMDSKGLLAAMIVCVAPSLLVADKRVGVFEAILMILLYISTLYIVQRKQNLIEKIETIQTSLKLDGKTHVLNVLKILIGLVLVFFSSEYIVRETVAFSVIAKVSPFLLSIVILSLGTNLPEFFLALRGIKQNKKDVAFGDYIGSASANTLIFGGLVFLNGGTVTLTNNFLQSLVFILIALVCFYFFARSKNTISRKEGIVLVMIYVCFVALEFWAASNG
ncbi:MAG: Na+/Ca+ antiporter, CaCA family [candidate division WWE3 bacterium GW2011_GWD2_42_11]|uniref:Sodium/calcium exchanger membrane region domain-containing protein n=3 Tax=Katanobacteria TaxID=422282 RepID=A0A1F4W0D4_UNCKA|nr:MAG: Na+/Ca+ antiporter, CaCA family [candidate division WWE3 bacterium GW2011_GWC2_41_23]KKS12054.1 MAG: Na+/Ca+ antiporter, CaCA family [candidate division WWE3 bacterium GW2011_GWF1_41_53]KKS20076.1 MAG: Na+/Ca+ antiporter, CaCA family [candidate division WWE3 bacterium GW2011_GWE1_41_72]KKS29457.1 MAG: Na+/Ca+ antiporter, CaCA family [candidate division WWE3 bacterium GW2011_GWD2_42_11]KKS50688.1 MAG: Na+/Ca+ antiporter, CaCA family [candidate division WWE3 bacterium GW2011_GWE2_42_25]K